MQITTLFVNYLYNVDIFSANTLPDLHAGLQVREFLGHNLEMIVSSSCDVCKREPQENLVMFAK